MYKILLNILLLIIIPIGILSAEKPAADDIERRVDSLFILASSGEIKYRDQVQPAFDSLVAMKTAAVPRLVGKLDSKVAREARAVHDILIKIGGDAVPALMTQLSNKNIEVVNSACYILGKIGDTTATGPVAGLAGDDNWKLRSSAVTALGEIGGEEAYETIAAAFSDTVDIVRKSAAVAAGRLKNEAAVPMLVGMFDDAFYGARLCAADALMEFGGGVMQCIADSLDSENQLMGNLGCVTLGRIGGDSAAVILSTQLGSPSPLRRALAVEGILHCNSSIACGAVELLAETEKDPLVLFYIEKVMERYAEK